MLSCPFFSCLFLQVYDFYSSPFFKCANKFIDLKESRQTLIILIVERQCFLLPPNFCTEVKSKYPGDNFSFYFILFFFFTLILL